MRRAILCSDFKPYLNRTYKGNSDATINLVSALKLAKKVIST